MGILHASACDIIRSHLLRSNYTKTEAEAAVAAMKAGTDMNCGCEYQTHLADAVGNGTVTHEEIDLAAGRITHAIIRTGGLDAEGLASPYTNIPTTKINDDAAAQLALEAAQQSIVLLQNKPVGGGSGKPRLPLKPSGSTEIAIVGPYANATVRVETETSVFLCHLRLRTE